MTNGEEAEMRMVNANLQKRVDALQAVNQQASQQNAVLVDQVKRLQADLTAANAAITAIERQSDTHRSQADAYLSHAAKFLAGMGLDETIAEHKRATDLARADAMTAEADRIRESLRPQTPTV